MISRCTRHATHLFDGAQAPALVLIGGGLRVHLKVGTELLGLGDRRHSSKALLTRTATVALGGSVAAATAVTYKAKRGQDDQIARKGRTFKI